MRTELRVTGMTCKNCLRHVEGALRQLAGVRSAEVSLEGASAVIDHDDEVGVAALCAAIVEAGYEAEASPASPA